MKMISCLVFLMCMTTSTVLAQFHIPSANVDGDIVTFDADFVWFDNYPIEKPYELIQGTVLMHDSILASSDGSSPIILKLKPGSYSMTLSGFPEDRMFPERTSENVTIVVDTPSRQELINIAYNSVIQARDSYIGALRDLSALNPTQPELVTARKQ